jgi:hypothetical protein
LKVTPRRGTTIGSEFGYSCGTATGVPVGCPRGQPCSGSARRPAAVPEPSPRCASVCLSSSIFWHGHDIVIGIYRNSLSIANLKICCWKPIDVACNFHNQSCAPWCTIQRANNIQFLSRQCLKYFAVCAQLNNSCSPYRFLNEFWF